LENYRVEARESARIEKPIKIEHLSRARSSFAFIRVIRGAL